MNIEKFFSKPPEYVTYQQKLRTDKNKPENLFDLLQNSPLADQDLVRIDPYLLEVHALHVLIHFQDNDTTQHPARQQFSQFIDTLSPFRKGIMLGLIVHCWPELEGIVDAKTKHSQVLRDFENIPEKQPRQLFTLGYLTYSRKNIIFNKQEEYVAVSTGELITTTGFVNQITHEE